MANAPTDVTLSLDDCEPNALPPACAKCGQPATCEKRVWFRHMPNWVAPVAFALFVLFLPCAAVSNKIEPLLITAALVASPFGLVLRKYKESRYAHLPVCERHQGLWNWGTTLAGFSFGVMPLFAIAGFVLASVAASLAGVPQWRVAESHFLAALLVGLPLCGVFVGVGLHFGTGVRASRITKADLTLVGVAPAFVEAVEAQQDADDAADRARRAARKSAGFATTAPHP